MNNDASSKLVQRGNSQWEVLLNKYVSVWLWSILFGTTTGVLYTFLSFRIDKWGCLAGVLAVPLTMALLMAIGSSLQLYRGLVQFLIPRYILGLSTDGGEKVFAYCLRRSFFFFVCAAFLRAIASILEILLTAVRY
jgi:hypothetical protein